MLVSLLPAVLGTLFIFALSTLGAALVFLPVAAEPRMRRFMLGFTGGVMLAAAVWSLILPAMERCRSLAVPAWLPVSLGIAAGAAFLSALESVLAHRRSDTADAVLVTAITLHNIPEGMAVGLAFALASDGEGIAAASALALGIGVQNFPEGAAVSLPLRQAGMSRGRAFAVSVLSSSVEPVFGIAAALVSGCVTPLMPWLLSFAAGAMLYVCASELIPEAAGRRGSLGFLLGFLLMMILDVALG